MEMTECHECNHLVFDFQVVQCCGRYYCDACLEAHHEQTHGYYRDHDTIEADRERLLGVYDD